MAKIIYKGITQNSSIQKKLTDEQFYEIEKQYYKLPDFNLVQKQLRDIQDGKTKINFIYNYYLKKIMSKAVGTRASWSIDDGIHNKEIMQYFAGKVNENKKVYPDTLSLTQKIEIAFRLCGIRYCVKLPIFPLRFVREILFKYNVNNNYYDFSCGWATRMLGALSMDVNYFGTQPNYELVNILNKIKQDYQNENIFSCSNVDIRCQGSQKIIPEWINKIGLAFSSPPYYNLQDYQIGSQQSYKSGMTYKEWSDSYIIPTVYNISQYLIKKGYFIVNVKSFRDYKTNEIYPIEDDFKKSALNNGLELIDIIKLQNIKRCHGSRSIDMVQNTIHFSDNDEQVYVFQK